MFFNDDLQQRVGTVLVALDALEESGEEGGGVPGELLDSESIGAGAAGVFLDALPGVPKAFGGDGEGHIMLAYEHGRSTPLGCSQ